MRSIFLSLFLAGTAILANAQNKSEVYKFEKITPEMLQRRTYALDSGANAVILADVGQTEIEGNAKGWFNFIFRRHRRVHILSKGGYDEATFSIPLYHQSSDLEERLENIKATSYNLENGKVVETKLTKDQIFTEKKNRNLDIKKITLPAVKEGTIIDIEYRITSDYLYTLQPWDFQGSTPRLWSEYVLQVPSFLEYLFIYKGYIPFYISEKSDRVTQFTVLQPKDFGPADRHQLTAGVTTYRWVTREVPGFRPEAFLSAPSNYLSHIDFQLAAYREPLNYRNLVPTWPQQAQTLLKDENFGQKLDNNNGYLSEVMGELMRGSKLEQAISIYRFVRDNVTCTQQEGIYLQNPVKDVFKSRKGSVAEVNLLLITMLRYAGIEADPVMISTRSHGTVFTTYPMLTRFNYILATVNIDGKTWHLDASKPRMGFGRLHPDCYNGMGRVVNNEASPVYLIADSLREKKQTVVFLGSPDKKGWTGSFQQTPGYIESYRMRRYAAEKGTATLFADLQKSLGQQIMLGKTSVDSLSQFDFPLGIRAELTMPLNDEDIVYISPMFGEGMQENPLKSPERLYPVEMPHAIDETFNMTLYVPDGYVLDELPKSTRMKLNEQNEGSFEYLISHSEGVISLRSRLRVGKATFTAQEYEVLREFFSQVVAKHKEQIVLKKKK